MTELESRQDRPSIEGVFMAFLHVSREDAETLAEWFATATWGNPTAFFNRSSDIKELLELRQAISIIIRFNRESSYDLQELFRRELLYIDIKRNKSENENGNPIWDPKIHDSWAASELHASDWKKAADNAISEIENSTLTVRSKARVNTEAINIVDRARRVWGVKTGGAAPLKGLNPATTFGRFISELFLACGCEDDPRSAFQAWARHMGEPVHSEGETD